MVVKIILKSLRINIEIVRVYLCIAKSQILVSRLALKQFSVLNQQASQNVRVSNH